MTIAGPRADGRLRRARDQLAWEIGMMDSRKLRAAIASSTTKNGRLKILRPSILVLTSFLLGACASEPKAPDAVEAGTGETLATQSKVCAQEPQTGSHLKRSGPSTVESISRDELERIKSRTNSMPMEPGTTRGGRP
jgi:hypothetical protein